MEFQQFRDLQRSHVRDMLANKPTLFTAGADKEALWNLYLDSFPPEANQIYRTRREFDCSCCRSFIKNFGNVVVVQADGKLRSIWDFSCEDSTYQPVLDELSRFITNAPINGVFVTNQRMFGTEVSRELRDDQVINWKHFYIDMPGNYIYNGRDTLDTVASNHRTNREVFERSLAQINLDAVETVLDLISQNSLYRGEEWKDVLQTFAALKKEYDQFTGDKNTWCWVKSVQAGPIVAKIKNHSIGVLLLDLTEGIDVDTAMRKRDDLYETYKRTQKVATPRMVEQAKKTVMELGLQNSLGRRFAVLDDITINDVLFVDRTAVKLTGDVFSKLSNSAGYNPKKYERVEEVSIDRFINEVLPRATGLEVLFENKHQSNLVSLIAPSNADAPGMFKWGNNFSWAYAGNITDSMRERVARAGGKIDGVLRFSIQWNEHGDNLNDFDAHAIEPTGNHIYYPNKGRTHPSSGMLDVDIIHPSTKEVAVENITWTDINKMREGIYELHVHCYSYRGGRSGFAAEIEYDGIIHQYEYRKYIPQGARVVVARLRFNKRSGIEFVEALPSSFTPMEVWGITTNQFIPVLAVMYSPNYWADRGIGNKHYIFALKNCINDGNPNGFFNEYLTEELMPHRRVFEALGREMNVESSNEQLSGLGFSSTRRNTLVVKVVGHADRILRVAF